jgi:hypothetical protein
VVEVDRWNRYLLPDPVTGQDRAWTRVTTLSSALANTYGLELWKLRQVALGMSRREDLLSLAASCTNTDKDKKTLNKIAREALEAAGSSRGANLGTAFHKLAEQWDEGQRIPHVRGDSRYALERYAGLLIRKGVKVVPEYTERIVCNTTYGVCGTLDRVVQWDGHDGLTIMDLKSQKDLSYSGNEITIQQACYATAQYMWNEKRGEWEPIPKLNQHEALIAWIPTEKKIADMFRVSIELGRQLASLAVQVREEQKRKDHFGDVPDSPGYFIRQIQHAQTIEEVRSVGHQAVFSIGEMTPDIREAGRARLAELKEKDNAGSV